MENMKKENLRELAPRIAHDINNPLAVILGSVELMMQEVPEDSPQRQDLERIQTAARRCARVTDSLFEYDDSGRETRAALRETAGSPLLGALR
jgi:signal transduction histidine kinase